MFGRKHHKRSTNPLFVIFRLGLSLVMFTVLLAGIYSAYKHFSGLDPLKLEPQQVLSEALKGKIPASLLTTLSSIKLTQGLSNKINQKVLGEAKQGQIPLDNLTNSTKSSKVLFNFLMVADSHNDNINLKKALRQAQAFGSEAQARRGYNPQFVIGLGDYTDVGTIKELQDTKAEFDSAGIRYFLTVGDHDLWDARNRSLSPNANFKEVFGPSYQSFTYNDFRFILLNNSDNYLGVDEEQMSWLSSELDKGKSEGTKGIFVFAHEPFYHPSSDHVMGMVENKLKQQAKTIMYVLKDAGVKEVFYGDIHFFTKYVEPQTNLNMVTVGAVTSDRNPQAPRYAVGHVLEDGSVDIEDVEIE